MPTGKGMKNAARPAPAGKKTAKTLKNRSGAKAPPPDAEGLSRNGGGLPIVGIGASAGGLEAFEAFFGAMPVDSGMAFVLVPHLDPTHSSILPELIQKRTRMPVMHVKDGMTVQENTVYIVPPNQDLAILHGTLQLLELRQPRGTNLPIDTFLRSLAQDQGANAVAIILPGTGSDGTQGVKAIKAETRMVMVQDQDSAKYDGMPRSAIATGMADYILPPAAMPDKLIKYLQHAGKTRATSTRDDDGKMSDTLQKICGAMGSGLEMPHFL